MSNEATIISSLQIRKDELNYQSRPTAFKADVSVGKGPTPGLVYATTTGQAVDLSLLTTPGLCWMTNLDTLNYVEVGIYDPVGKHLFPLLELLPGECVALRLSRFIGKELGTGTKTDATGEQLMLRGVGGNCYCRVEAFEN